MGLAVYVHIPYCIQRCRYCDFITFEQNEILAPELYVAQVLEEIRRRRALWPESQLLSLYFGGGTPSLIEARHILAICDELKELGLSITDQTEATIEINPATLTKDKLEAYLSVGINRFSVGAQTFNDRLLGICGRRHSAHDTRKTLELLTSRGLNYSFDLLFALPQQSLAELEADLDEVTRLSPPHLSAYCLTVPSGHPMSYNRPSEDVQVEMFNRIENRLLAAGLARYEISNFAKPSFESRHNQAYWFDQSFWGIGVSAHSYAKNEGPYGTRLWNSKSLTEYAQSATRAGTEWVSVLGANQMETLTFAQALTDWCHVRLRTSAGMTPEALRNKFGVFGPKVVALRMKKLIGDGLIEDTHDSSWKLTAKGLLISNKVFEELTFLSSDEDVSTLTDSTENPYCLA